MSTLFLSLISTPTSHVKLVTETKEDAVLIVNSSDLLDQVGGFEGLDFQFEINSREINNFDNFSGAKYKPFENGFKMSNINDIPYMISFMDKDEAEVAIAFAESNYDNNVEEADMMIDNDNDYNYDNATAMVDNIDIDPSYNPDDAW